MRFQVVVFVLAVLGIEQCYAAEKTADFIGGRYTKTVHGCAKDTLSRGSAIQNAETIPDMMDSKGLSGWQRSCKFQDITEVKPGKVWSASMGCVEDEKESVKTFTFSKGAIENTIEVLPEGNAEADIYFLCIVD